MLKRNLYLPIRNSLFLLPIIVMIFLMAPLVKAKSNDPTKYWDIQSIDTMKYSRDTTAAKINDPNFDQEIGTQIRNIKATGANFVAVDTPYDEQYLPFLRRWVVEARKNNLHVWFRGNFSAWEGWFGYKKGMSTQEHTNLNVQFIKNHPEIFEDGDIFSSCPECENGAIGDPRQTNQVSQYRQFIVSETQATTQAFQDEGKKVTTNYWSMNLDVAKLIMDQELVQKMGGVVVIDHYVSTPQQLISDADELAQKTGFKIILGEFGAPIPDLNGNMTENEQTDWLENSLNLASKSPNIIGLNYWVNKGGSTAIWDDNNNPKLAVTTLSNYYNPPTVGGQILDEFGNPLDNVVVSNQEKQVISQNGEFTILDDGSGIRIDKDGYEQITLNTPIASNSAKITLIKKDKNLVELVKLWVKNHVKIAFP